MRSRSPWERWERKRWERVSAREVETLHLDALRRLLQHAYATCPFYRERFDAAGLRPGHLTAASELERLPPLTRADLRAHGAAIRSRAFASASLLPAASGGTTDTPVPLWRDRASLRAKLAMQRSLQAWAGWRRTDKVFHLWGARSDFAQHPSWRWRLYDRYIQRQLWAPSSQLTPAIFEHFRQQWNQFRPHILHAYASPAALWAGYLLRHGGLRHHPRAVVVTAEALLPAHRALIERAFACPVFELYGSREFGIIAAECEHHRGLHVHPAAAHVEFRPVAGDLGVREMLVTDLLGYGMPLIRYQINDCVVGEAASCPCRRPFPLLPPIAGRTGDIFHLPNGILVPGVSINRMLPVTPGIRQIQIVQETLTEFRLRYVPDAGFVPDHLQLVRARLREFFGDTVHWRYEPAAEIARSASGKTRFCICRLPAPSPEPAALASVP